MAVIMLEVPEGANRLDEMVDQMLGGERVVFTRGGRPIGMLVPFDESGRPGAGAGIFGHHGPADPSPEGPFDPGPEIILVRRRVCTVACML